MMRFRIWITIALFVPLALLAVANWSALFQPVEIDLFIATVYWPPWPFVVALPVLLALVYLGAGLLDRARHLRQVSALERQLEEARATVDRGREAALDAVATRLEARIGALESVFEGTSSGLEQRLGDRFAALDAHLDRTAEAHRGQLDVVAARVSSVRDELAADVGAAEDALMRALHDRDHTLEVDRERPADRPALTGGEG